MAEFETGFHALDSAKEYEKQAQVDEDDVDDAQQVSVVQDAGAKDASVSTGAADEGNASNS